jgi:hypothetical protein
MRFLVAVGSLRVSLDRSNPSHHAGESPAISPSSPLGGHLPRRVLETIQETGDPVEVVTEWRASSGIAAESLRAQGPGGGRYGGADAV